MTGYIRKDTTNNIADGNVINATDLDNEFDGVQAAFVVATGHTHDGTASEGAAITKIGPVQDVVVSIAAMYPKTTNTIDLGTSSLKYKDAFFAGNASVGGTLAVTGVATLTAQPILSSLTASSAVATDASKGLVSVTNTGTGNNVLATSPTLVTPILGTPQSVTLTNATGLPIGTGVSGLGTGVATALAVNVGSAGAAVVNGGALGTPSSGTVTNLTGTASININGTVGATTANTGAFTTLTTSSTVTINGGTANGVAYLNGSKVLTTGTALTFDGSLLKLASGAALSVQGVAFPSSGAGTEIFWDGTQSVIQSYNRTSSAYTPLWLESSYTRFGINNTEQMILTSSGLEVKQSQLIGYSSYAGIGTNGLAVAGNVGIGTSSPAATSRISAASAVATASQVEIKLADTTNSSYIQMMRTGATYSYAGMAGNEAAIYSTNALNLVADGANVIKFSTNTTERARIDASGNLLVGTTSPLDNSKLSVLGGATDHTVEFVNPASTGYAGLIIKRPNSTGAAIIFGQGGSDVGSVSLTSVATLYNTTSDYRLKTVIGAVSDAGSRIDALHPIEYEWNSDGSRTRGFLAHQFQEVYAGSVSGTKDSVDADGKPVYQAMQAGSSEVIADLVAEIQDLRKRLAAAGIA